MTLIIARRNREKGAASLLSALILLICITLVVLLTTKTVLVETQITADNYRTSQATAAASAAMNEGIAYYMAGGIDQNNDGTVDFLIGTRSLITLTVPGQQTTTANFYFNNTPGNGCDCPTNDCLATTNMTKARIVAQGFSDDRLATRTLSQCLTTFPIFSNGQGPQQPFVGRQSAGVLGNARIINRHTNSTIWIGGDIDVTGASFGTYIRPSGTQASDYTTDELNDPDETATDAAGDPTQQEVSDRDSGIGIDVISNDPTLGNKTPDEMFDTFFSTTKPNMMTLADNVNQRFPVGTDIAATAPNATGIIWVGDNSATPSTTDTTVSGTDVIGSTTNPVVMIVNGDFKMTGGTINGVVYVMGELTITGNPVVKGSIVSESGDSSGAGTLNLVYVPYGDNGNTNPPFITGTGAVLTGSWTDWVGN